VAVATTLGGMVLAAHLGQKSGPVIVVVAAVVFAATLVYRRPT
jgi:ABC-type Mn2+/Zn2+ transport system permease subunit